MHSSTAGQPGADEPCHQRVIGLLAAGPRRVWDSGLTCSFLASLIFSFSALFVKLTGGRVPVLEVCLVRSSISAGLSLALMQLSGMPWRLFYGKRKNLKILFLRGCCGACSMTTYYIALFMLPLGDAVTINLIGAPVTAIFARLLLKEPLGYRGMAGCVVSLAGVVLVARPPFLFGGGHEEWARTRAIGSAAGVLSAVLGGGSSMTIRIINASEPAAVIALWFHTATMLLSVFPLLAGFPNKPVLLAGPDAGYMMGVAGTSFVAQLLVTRGLQRCQAAKATAMSFTQVVYSNIMGAVFFGDKMTPGGALGTLLVLAGVLLVTMRTAGSDSKAGKGPAACPATTAAAEGSGHLLCAADSDRVSLLSGNHMQSHLAPAASAQLAEDEAAVAGALAVVRLRSAGSLSSKQGAGSQMGPASEAGQLLGAARADSAAAGADTQPEAGEPDLLAQIAASAAAALGGELCPAGSAVQALELSRQVSRQLACSRAVSQMSCQPSQYLFGSPSAFMTAPGLPGLSARPWAQPQQQSEPPAHQVSNQQGWEPSYEVRQEAQPQQQQWHSRVEGQTAAAAGAAGGGLKQALLPGDSAPSSPVCSPSMQRVLQLCEEPQEAEKH